MANTEKSSDYYRYYQIAGVVIKVEADIPITDKTFYPKFEKFRADGPSEDMITFRHHFSIPELDMQSLGKEVFKFPPWAVYKNEDIWTYVGIVPETHKIWRVVICNKDHSVCDIYNPGEAMFVGPMSSLSCLPTDQMLIARVLGEKDACYIHSSALIYEGKGLVFTGHSDAGKTTMANLIGDRAELLCDDRNIVRKWPEGHRIHGTWSHGDIPEVSSNSAPLTAILFLEQAKENKLIPLKDKRDIMRRLLACLIKPHVTTDWWEKSLTIIEDIADSVPCYIVRFDKSGDVVDLFADL